MILAYVLPSCGAAVASAETVTPSTGGLSVGAYRYDLPEPELLSDFPADSREHAEAALVGAAHGPFLRPARNWSGLGADRFQQVMAELQPGPDVGRGGFGDDVELRTPRLSVADILKAAEPAAAVAHAPTVAVTPVAANWPVLSTFAGLAIAAALIGLWVIGTREPSE